MTTRTSDMTFENLIKRHSELITRIIANTPGDEKPAAIETPEQFADQVELASIRLTATPLWWSEQEEMETAHRYLTDALNADEEAERAVLLKNANQHLDTLDPTDFLG